MGRNDRNNTRIVAKFQVGHDKKSRSVAISDEPRGMSPWHGFPRHESPRGQAPWLANESPRFDLSFRRTAFRMTTYYEVYLRRAGHAKTSSLVAHPGDR